MICENCHAHQATIQLNLQINGHKRQVHLCNQCYQEIKNEWKTPSFQLGGGAPYNDMTSGFQSNAQQENQEKQGSLLDNFGRNITDAARIGLIDPVIGRDKEIDRVIETLNRRNKNNPVLIGEPGVGKTAIAEGLALKIIEGQVPAKLQDKQIYLLDVASLISNTGIRGQFEERMKQLIDELQSRENIILFIDEVHQLVGAGSAEGSMDAGNILKPALARGELQVIGATTLKEYRQIEKDAALERRFQPVLVNEPVLEEAVAILTGLKERYEDYHKVHFSDEAIRACVTLSDRYIQDRFLPDKAIDLMDEAGSKINLTYVKPDSSQLKTRLKALQKEKENATQTEAYETAAKLRDQELELIKQLDEDVNENNNVGHTVTVEDIQSIVEAKTGIPIKKLERNEQNKMKHLADQLNSKIIGQSEAVNKVAKAIRRNRAGLRRTARPIGSFLFAGPTGVGKTELARTLAEEMFGNRDAMIRLDMSEYMEKHSVSKLIGAPPGYVGHEEAGQLTEKVRRKPYSLILLDEIEKAHPDVQHSFLQILEDGRLTDSQGRTVSFKDTVIIATTNAGGEKSIKVGFGQEKVKEEQNVLGTLTNQFRPEFLNRFDGIIRFGSLKKKDLTAIVELLLKDVEEVASEQGMTLTVSDAAKEKLAELGYSPTFGARPLRRVIEEYVEDAIADRLVDLEEPTSEVTIDVKGNEITVR